MILHPEPCTQQALIVCTTLIPATPCLWLCSMRHPWTMMFTPLWTQLAVPSLPTCYPPWPGGSPSVLSPPATASTPPRCVSTPRAVPTSSRALVRASPCDAGGRLALAMYTNGQCEIRSPVQNAHCVLETVRSKQSLASNKLVGGQSSHGSGRPRRSHQWAAKALTAVGG